MQLFSKLKTEVLLAPQKAHLKWEKLGVVVHLSFQHWEAGAVSSVVGHLLSMFQSLDLTSSVEREGEEKKANWKT